MDDQLKSNLTSSEHWTRFIYMLLFAVFLYVASLLAAVLVIAQFVFALISGAPNPRLRSFGGEVATYINQIWMFLTYNSEEKAYPFADWPSVENSDAPVQAPVAESAVAEPEPMKSAPEPEPVIEVEPTAESEADEERKPEKMDS